jgi:WD40 repeat protein
MFARRYRFNLIQLFVATAIVASLVGAVLSLIQARWYGSIYCVAYSPRGETLAAATEDHVIKLWNLSTGQVQTLAGNRNSVRSLAFSPDGKLLASGSLDTSVLLWDVSTGDMLAVIPSHVGACLAFSPDGKTLAIADQWNAVVILWDTTSRQKIATLKGHASAVTAVAFSPDGRKLLSGSSDQSVKLWDVASKGELRSFSVSRAVTSVAFSPNGQLIAAGADLGGVTLWDEANGRQVQVLQGEKERIASIAFSPDGALLATGSVTQDIHMIFPGNVRFTMDGNRTDFVGVKVWDVAMGQPKIRIASESAIWSVAFSPDGAMLAGGADGWATRVWNVANGREVTTFLANRRPTQAIWWVLGASLIAWGVLRRRSRSGLSDNPRKSALPMGGD